MTYKEGQKVICNGFRGVIKEVCSGQLVGMLVVQLERGTVCVSASPAAHAVQPEECLGCEHVSHKPGLCGRGCYCIVG